MTLLSLTIRKQSNSSRHFMMPIWTWAIFTRYRPIYIKWWFHVETSFWHLSGKHCFLGCWNVSRCNFMLSKCSTGMPTKCNSLWWVYIYLWLILTKNKQFNLKFPTVTWFLRYPYELFLPNCAILLFGWMQGLFLRMLQLSVIFFLLKWMTHM